MAPAAIIAKGRRSHPKASRLLTLKRRWRDSVAHSRSKDSGDMGVTEMDSSASTGASDSGVRSSEGRRRKISAGSSEAGSCVVAYSLVVMST